MMRIIVEFGVELVARSPGAVAVRVAALDDKSRLDAVERQTVVKPGAGKLDKRRTVRRRVV